MGTESKGWKKMNEKQDYADIVAGIAFIVSISVLAVWLIVR